MSDVLAPDPSSSPRNATHKPLGDELFELALTRENKTELFEEAISKLSKSSQEASSILENLNKWNPSDASRFVPRSSSTILDTPFRLVFPNSALQSFEETGLYVRQFLAVSYCWHSDEFLPEGYERHVNWPISRPFVDAILDDKDHPREGIWIDQLCIDQSSSIDKGKSVAAMDIIYRSCIRLLVLLEDVFLDEREAALHEKYDPTQMAFDRKWTPEGDDKNAFTTFYKKVNAARWWKRAWCLHEFSVNDPWTDKRQCHQIHNATFIINGPKGSTVKIKWVNLQLIMGSALFAMPNLEFNGHYIFSGVVKGTNLDNATSRSSIMARYFGVNRQGSTHLGDRLSIIMNMSGLGLAYVGPQLSSEDEVLYFSTLLALASGEFYPLTMFSGQSILLDNKATWLARSVGLGDTSIPRFNVANVNGIHRITKEAIELDLIFFKSALKQVKGEDLVSTYTIFPDTIRTTQPARYIASESPGITWSERPDTTLDLYRRRFLASCIINGHDFTARLWSQLKHHVVVPNYNTGLFKALEPNSTLISAARELIAQLLPISTLLCIPPADTFTLDDAHLFLTWLTDPRSMYYLGAYTYSLTYNGNGDEAFLTSLHINEHFADGPAEELQVVIPKDLLKTTCMGLRVWLLRPGKDRGRNSKWRLVAKGLLLGEPDLLEAAQTSNGNEGVGVPLMERVAVSG